MWTIHGSYQVIILYITLFCEEFWLVTGENWVSFLCMIFILYTHIFTAVAREGMRGAVGTREGGSSGGGWFFQKC